MDTERQRKMRDAIAVIGKLYGSLAMHGLQIDWDKFDAMKAELEPNPMAFWNERPYPFDAIGYWITPNAKPSTNPFYPLEKLQ